LLENLFPSNLKYLKLNNIFLVSIGVIPGALIRWQFNNDIFVNLFGSFILGFIVSCKLKKSLMLVFSVGFCGGLTTFSSWMLDTYQLISKGLLLNALILIILPICLALIFAGIGYWIGFMLKYWLSLYKKNKI